MKKNILAILVFLYLPTKAQTAQIEIPETYELSNIILALTDYGIADEWEVQKKTEYYKEVIAYFEPVKNHPLLDSVNYSREKWADYLSFRTDAVAFSFDESGKLCRRFEFYANKGHNPFDKNLDLINDFILKSGFREFYKEHHELYNRVTNNYEDYNFVKQTMVFLKTNIADDTTRDNNKIYKIILSPLVYRMNCHRELGNNLVADFPSASENFINGVKTDENIDARLNSNHGIFTEKDHEYINPITTKYLELVTANFNPKFWDQDSGYADFNSFNEYMTWAVYDLFLDAHFSERSQELSTYWNYQNASRGFIAQNLFSGKVKELYKKNKGQKFENIYKPLLKWTKKVEKTISLPTLLNIDTQNFVKADVNNIKLDFSEEMNTELPIGLEIREFKDGRATGNKIFTQLVNFKWSKDKKQLNFKIETDYEEFALIFNWHGIDKPLISKKGIFLKPLSYIQLKK